MPSPPAPAPCPCASGTAGAVPLVSAMHPAWGGFLIHCGGTLTVGPSQVGTGTGDHDSLAGTLRLWWFPNGSLSSRNLGKSGLRVSCLGLGKCRGLCGPSGSPWCPLVPQWLPARAALTCSAKARKGFSSGPAAVLRHSPEVVKLFSPFFSSDVMGSDRAALGAPCCARWDQPRLPRAGAVPGQPGRGAGGARRTDRTHRGCIPSPPQGRG